jgi:hypothetical protein
VDLDSTPHYAKKNVSASSFDTDPKVVS